VAVVQYHKGRFPPASLDLSRLLPLVGPANAGLARFDATLAAVPNVNVLLSPLTTQEAVLSSKIEGTQATIGEVFEFEAGDESADEEKKGDIQEILNYRSAMRNAVSHLKAIPLSQRLIRDAHRVLMTGVRGRNKTPGDYRRVANWIGEPGCTLTTARFVPPASNLVPDAMSAWERYVHAEVPDRLVQLAILHAEFESIHPFLDGNGRLGRLFVPLFLVEKGLLSQPNFYISAFLELNRDEYYDRLLAVSRDDDWTGWCVFFLRAVVEQARENAAKARAILDLYRRRSDWISTITRSHQAVRALDWFFNRPIFRTTEFIESAGIAKPTANRILTIVREKGLLRVIHESSGRRAATLAFSELLNIAEGRSIA